MKTKPTQLLKIIFAGLVALLAMLAVPSVFAASQTWSTTPVSGEWSNTVNWVGGAAPGALGFSTAGQNDDTMTFNSPLSGLIGGESAPFRSSDTNRQVRYIIFDTIGCGPYVLVASNGFPLGLSATLSTAPGGIGINAAVTNAQRFEIPVVARLQNSQNGAIGFTNNSTTASATLTIANMTNASASSRPLFLNLVGSNSGSNVIGHIDNNAGANGAIHIFKWGSGTWVLAGPNDIPQKTSAGGGGAAHAEINEGTLVVRDVASLGALAAANIFPTNTGVLQIDGITPQNLGMSIRNGGTIRMNGSGGINGLIVGNQVGTTATLATTSLGNFFTNGIAGVVSGGAADTVLNVNGPGTLVLNTANTYVGRWSFNAGTNMITHPSGLGTGASTHIAAGAMVDSSGLGAYALTTAAISANGTGTAVGSTASAINAGTGGTFDCGIKAINLTYTPTTFTGDTTHPAIYVVDGALSLSGNAFTINNASGTPLGAGTYRLIEQAVGSVISSGGSFPIVTGSGLGAGLVADIQVTGGFVNLVVYSHVSLNLTWQGGNPNSDWDNALTANWYDGVSLVQFGNSDAVTFNSLGLVNPNVNIAQTVQPGTLKVDASTNAYTFSGVGQIAGATSLVKVGTNILTLATVNSYLGGTVVSNGTLRVGIDDAIPSTGAGNLALYSPAVLDLGGFSDTVNGLVGNGTVDNLVGGASTLSVGANNSSTTFTGLVQNTTGTTALRKLGTGTLTLPLANTHSGGTIIEGGTLRVDNYNGFGTGPVTNNAGILNITTNVTINSLNGLGGTIANNSSALPVIMNLQGVGEYTGVIANGSGGGNIRLIVRSGTTRLNGNSTYTNGTFVASGATLAIGVINPGGSGVPGTGGIIASNGATISLPTSVSTSQQVPNAITNIDAGGTVYFPSIGQANSFNGQFVGGASNTNMFSGPMTIGGATSFSNFLGTVVVSNGASVRFFNANGGGESTTFELRGGLFSRDASTIRLGALTGSADGGIYNPSVGAPATFHIGAKGLNTTFTGVISGSNNIVKVGAGSLTLNGVTYATNIVTLPDPFEPTNIVSYTLFSNRVTYLGSTTVSNNILRIVAPNNLTNSPSITLAGVSAVLDASQIGYSTNETVIDYNLVEQATNTVVITTATVQLLTNQTLNGLGTIWGSVSADLGSAINPGLPLGTLTITNVVTLNGTVNMELNRSNLTQNCDRLVAGSFAGSGATLNVTNLGPTLVNGNKFQLFNGPVTAFTLFNLPTTGGGGLYTYTWQNDVAGDGSITLISGGLNTTPPTLTNGVVNGTNLVLSWPLDYTGWTLQRQTNPITIGISNNWSAVTNSTLTNLISIPIVRTNPTVFYRLNLPLP